jgi:hypothetical protein
MLRQRQSSHPDAPRFFERGEGSCVECCRNFGSVAILARSLTRLKCAEFRDDVLVRNTWEH